MWDPHLSESRPNLTKPLNCCCFRLRVVGPTSCCILAEHHRTVNCCCFRLGLSWFHWVFLWDPHLSVFWLNFTGPRTVAVSDWGCLGFRLGLSWDPHLSESRPNLTRTANCCCYSLGVVVGPTPCCILAKLYRTVNCCCFRLGVVVGPTPCCILAEPHRTFTVAVPSSRVPRTPQLPQCSPLIASRDPSSLTVTRLTKAATLHLAISHPLFASLTFTFHG